MKSRKNSLYFWLKLVAKIIGLSTCKIERRFKSFGLSSRTRYYTKMLEDDLESHVTNIKQEFPKLGYGKVMGIRRSASLKRNMGPTKDSVRNYLTM